FSHVSTAGPACYAVRLRIGISRMTTQSSASVAPKVARQIGATQANDSLLSPAPIESVNGSSGPQSEANAAVAMVISKMPAAVTATPALIERYHAAPPTAPTAPQTR